MPVKQYRTLLCEKVAKRILFLLTEGHETFPHIVSQYVFYCFQLHNLKVKRTLNAVRTVNNAVSIR